MGRTRDRYTLEGQGFRVEVWGEEIPVAAIVGGVIDSTLGAGDSLKITREVGPVGIDAI